MKSDDLDKLESLASLATPGPWTYWPDHYMLRTDETFINDRKEIAATSCGNGSEHANGAFIAAARTAIPELIKEMRRLREIVS